MASNPPFELEDQTDEDFFDKLVDDDDDDVVVSGVGVKSTLEGSIGLVKENLVVDGDESDEVKPFANLSINEVDQENIDLMMKEVGESVDEKGGSKSVEVIGERVCNGEVTSSLALSDSVSFDNTQLEEDKVRVLGEDVGVPDESNGLPGGAGVKQVQWSAFAGSDDHDSGGFGPFNDFLSDFGQGEVENVQNEPSAVFENETITNAATGSAHSQTEQIANGVDSNSAEYYEMQYPGWKFDPTTGQWYQLDVTGGNATGHESLGASDGNMQGNLDSTGEGQWAVSSVNSSQGLYSQQNVPTTVETVSQVGTGSMENVSDGKNSSPQNWGYQYPAHMVFDPQYPGWYYDTLAQEWRSLDEYHSSRQSTELTYNQQSQDGFSGATYSNGTNGQVINGSNELQVPDSEQLNANHTSAASIGQYNLQGSNDRQSNSGSAVSYGVGQSWPSYDSNVYNNSQVSHPTFSNSREDLPSYDKTNQSLDSSTWAGYTGNGLQLNHASKVAQNGVAQYSNEIYDNHNVMTVSQPSYSNGHHASFVPSETRSLTGRPPHALVTFGFGGKLLVMKDTSTAGFSLHGSKGAEGHSISVHNLMEVVDVNRGPSGTTTCDSSYFQTLCHQSFPGPLVGGNAGSRELNRWTDERIANYESRSGGDGKGEALKLLLSLLKISCQHYGKLRSFPADGLKDDDLPESAVASLFASAKRNSDPFSQHNAIRKCLMTLPPEAQVQGTASEVEHLLISGKKREALQRAQEGQFWGFALILARELGDQFYADTVKQMAVSQLVTGSPLRTLCLLIAKKPEEVFSNSVTPDGNLSGAVAMSQQPAQSAGYSMLANWEENLAVITANRTENDNLVIIHLGDCLWKERNDVTAAHICYLIAEADFELYSDTSRLCLVGADHWNFPRTYASPEAIQRTELFEYAKVTGNSQFVLLPLQAYKLIYAHMLAEVGRVSDSLKYCQAVHKALKTARSPEVDVLKQLLSSLEERIRAHQQSGYAANLAPKIVGKILNLFDSTAQRVVGGLPPPAPSTTLSNGQQYQSPGSMVRSSQSTMVMSSLMPSGAVEPTSRWAGNGNKMTVQSRSISAPDMGRSPRPDPADNSNEATSSSANSKNSGSAGTSRFGRFSFGTQILQKTVGLVLKPRQGRQAKLGDSNKFYYDEKLKRWVEEGAEPPAEEPALAPPPTTATFQTEKSNIYPNNAFSNGINSTGGSPELARSTPPGNSFGSTPPGSSFGSTPPGSSFGSTPPGSSFGIPAIPQSSNQFSARGRMGVRSRYVDTFNKGGGTPTNAFQTPSIPSAQPGGGFSSAKLFIPTATSQNQGTDVSESETQKSSIPVHDPFQNLAPSPAGTMQRYPSVGNIPNKGAMRSGFSPEVAHSRRTASWSDMHNSDNHTSSSTAAEVKASPLSFMPSNHSSGSLHNSGGSLGDDLQEVEL